MDNVFLKYMNDRVKDENLPPQEPGPVITLSREFGCYASRIAQLLTARLTDQSDMRNDSKRWSYISNEILEEAANKLEVEPSKISHIFGADEKRFVGDLVESFSTKKYASDSNIKKTITTIVRSYAEHGNIIIVGRAGCVIAKHIPRSLHVKLIAPFEWRAHRTRERLSISDLAAKKMVMDSDEKRKVFMTFFKGDKPESDLFDLTLNRARLTEEEIVTTIYNLAKSKHFV